MFRFSFKNESLYLLLKTQYKPQTVCMYICDHRFDISYKSGPPSPKHHNCSSCYFDEYDLQDGSIDYPHTDDIK